MTLFYLQLAVKRAHRLWAAMALLELCNDTPVHRVAEMYGVPRGDMQSLRQTAVAFAGMVSAQCNMCFSECCCKLE
jgi:hypothetical protein